MKERRTEGRKQRRKEGRKEGRMGRRKEGRKYGWNENKEGKNGRSEGAKEGRKERSKDRRTEGRTTTLCLELTISMTSFRRLCLCLLLRFWKMSQFSSWSSLNPTARWWFSSTDSSLYIRASSESVGGSVTHRDYCFLLIPHPIGMDRSLEDE